jgi:hypothetical protein
LSSVKKTIILTAEYYGKQLSETVLEMYAEDLADLDPTNVVAGYQQYRRNPANRTFPLPAQIRELVCPEEYISVEAQAREIAARIVGAVSQFGWNGGKEARAFIGPEGWDVVQRQGGWSHICENLGVTINPTAFQAQLRDQLEGTLRYGKSAVDSAIRLEGRRAHGGLVSIGSVLSRALSAAKPGGSEPEGAA